MSDFPHGLVVKNLPANAGDVGLIRSPGGFHMPCSAAKRSGNFLVVQWLRIYLPMQGTQVRSLVQEDPTCQGATRPMLHNY